MSHHVVSEVYKRQVGKMPRVPLLALMADKASDDGRGIWASKQTLADELGCSKQTVITTVDNLIADGLLIVVGDRACSNGHTVEYRIDIDALEALPLVGCHQRKASKKLTGQKSGPVKKIDPTGQKSGPDQSKVLTQTSLEPSLKQEPPNPLGRGSERAAIPDDWILPGLDDLPPVIAALAQQWPDGAYQAEGAAFHQHWRGRGTKRLDWAASWAARVQARHESVMKAGKSGVPFIGSAAAGAAVVARPPVAAKRREDERSAELHEAIAAVIGQQVWVQWFEPVALIFEDVGLTVVVPSPFHAAQLETTHGASIRTALSRIGRGVDWTHFVVDRGGKTTGTKGAQRG